MNSMHQAMLKHPLTISSHRPLQSGWISILALFTALTPHFAAAQTNSTLTFGLVPPDSGSAVVAFQFDVKAPSGFVLGTAKIGSGAGAVVADSNKLSNGSHRYIVYSPALAAIPAPGKNLLEVALQIGNPSKLANGILAVEKAMFVDKDAKTRPARLAAAPVIVSATSRAGWPGMPASTSFRAVNPLSGPAVVASAAPDVGFTLRPPGATSASNLGNFKGPLATANFIPDAPGQHQITATARAGGLASKAMTNLTVPSGNDVRTYEDYKKRFLSGVEAAQQASNADPDGDGFSNGLEYVTGGDPLDPEGTDFQLQVARVGDSVELSFLKPKAMGLAWGIGQSRDLTTWTTANHTVAADKHGFERVSARIPLTSAQPTGFLRVQLQNK